MKHLGFEKEVINDYKHRFEALDNKYLVDKDLKPTVITHIEAASVYTEATLFQKKLKQAKEHLGL